MAAVVERRLRRVHGRGKRRRPPFTKHSPAAAGAHPRGDAAGRAAREAAISGGSRTGTSTLCDELEAGSLFVESLSGRTVSPFGRARKLASTGGERVAGGLRR